jgi:cell division septation protein DedD
MRDANRLKEKIELHLDRRQVTSVSVVALVLSASIFALGVMVGKNLSPPTHVAAPEALLERLDALADGGGAPSPEPLTFQDELTRRLPKSPQPKSTKPVTPSISPGIPRENASPNLTPSAVVITGSSDAGVQKITSLPELVERDSGVEVAVAPKLSSPKLPQIPKVFFTVQAKSTQSSAEADKFAQKLKAQGFHPQVAVAEVADKGKWYRIRVGQFDSRAQADHYLLDFKRETHLEAFVTAAGH